jgi:hypothetical protein
MRIPKALAARHGVSMIGPLKRARAFERRGVIYLHLSSRTSSWIYMATPPFLAVAQQDREKLAEAVRTVLAASQSPIDEPPDDVMDPLYAMAGVRTWAAFMKGARLLKLAKKGGMIELQPCRNGAVVTYAVSHDLAEYTYRLAMKVDDADHPAEAHRLFQEACDEGSHDACEALAGS